MNQMEELKKMLDSRKVSYVEKELWGGQQIIHYDKDGNRCFDVVWHPFSYGNEEGLLEPAGVDDEIDYTAQTAKNIFEHIMKKKGV